MADVWATRAVRKVQALAEEDADCAPSAWAAQKAINVIFGLAELGLYAERVMPKAGGGVCVVLRLDIENDDEPRGEG